MILFRPCIDIYQGKVKQLVGSSLIKKKVQENFSSSLPPVAYGHIYNKKKLNGGHVIMLSQTLEDQKVVLELLKEYPRQFHLGGGMDDKNALFWLEQGAKKIIFTSYIFNDEKFIFKRAQSLAKKLTKNKMVIDLSCIKKRSDYFVATHQWEKVTFFKINRKNLTFLSKYCSEFLIHAVSHEGEKRGIDLNLIKILQDSSPIDCVYGGGVSHLRDIDLIKKWGKGRVSFTIGSSLDLFGGHLNLDEVISHSNY